MRRALLPVVLAALLLAPAASAWTWPAGGPVLQPFLFDPSHPYAAGQHRGIDLGGSEGSPVLAPAAGTVSFAGTVPSSGKSVTIETPDGYSVTLTHLGSISVAGNAAVGEGSPVGTIGPSGDGEVSQPYVHLGVRLTGAGSGVSGSSDAAAAAGRCSAGRACACPDPSACFTAGIRARSGLTARPNGRRRCAVGHVHSRAGGFARARSRATARPGDRYAACGRRGGVGRAACRRGSRPRGPTRGGRRTRAQGHGDEAHRSAGSCAAGRCAALLDGHARRDARSRAVDSPRRVGTWLEHDRCPRALPGSREWRTGAGRSPARGTSELVSVRRERSPRPDRREPRAAGSAAPACTESRCHSGRGGAHSAPRNSPLGPRRLSPRASARPRGDGTRGEAAKGRAYHCSRCAST